MSLDPGGDGTIDFCTYDHNMLIRNDNYDPVFASRVEHCFNQRIKRISRVRQLLRDYQKSKCNCLQYYVVMYVRAYIETRRFFQSVRPDAT